MDENPMMSDQKITPEMIAAAYSVLQKYGVRDVLEIDSDIMRETLTAVFSACRRQWRYDCV